VVSVLYRDALLNYALVLILVNLALLPLPLIRSRTFAPAMLGWQRVAHAILGSRTLLHMRKANQVRWEGSIDTVTAMRFRAVIDSFGVVEQDRDSSLSSERDRLDGTEFWLAPISVSDTLSLGAVGVRGGSEVDSGIALNEMQ